MSLDAELDSEVEEDTEEMLNNQCPHCKALAPFAYVNPDGSLRCAFCGAYLC